MFTVPAPKNPQDAALQARVLQRALYLWQDGYDYDAVTELQAVAYYLVHSPEGKTYTVDPLIGTCDCPFFEEHKYCKHSLAIEQELEAVARYEAEDANAECSTGCDAYAEF